MYDSTNPLSIPADATEVAGYIDGLYAWPASAWARFTKATVKLTITVLGDLAADVCDCETGDLTPARAAAWARQKTTRPTIYCNLSTRPAVEAELARLGMAPTQVDWWIAHYTNQPHLEAGSVETQWEQNVPSPDGVGIVDLSDTAPGVGQILPSQPKPPVPHPPLPKEIDTMVTTLVANNNHHAATVTKSGELVVWWCPPGGPWHPTLVTAGCEPGQPVALDAFNGHLHAFAEKTDGGIVHAFAEPGHPWETETLPAAA